MSQTAIFTIYHAPAAFIKVNPVTTRFFKMIFFTLNTHLALRRSLLVAFTMVLSGCAAVQPPQLIKEPARGERIDISRLNVAIFPPNIRPPGGSQVAGAEGMLPLIGPASVEVRSELINQLPQLLANANMAVESKKIYSTPGRNVDLPAEFSNANAGTFFLTVFEVGSKAVCPIFFGNCGISTKYQVNLARAGEQALWSALFVFDTGALSSVNAEYVRVNLITPIAQEVIRVSQSK